MDDAQLKSYLTLDAPPASDPRFVTAVMTRMEQRRFRHEVFNTAALMLGGIPVSALLAPALVSAWQSSVAPFTNNGIVIVLAMALTFVAPQIFGIQNE
jgi:hypothetical protein